MLDMYCILRIVYLQDCLDNISYSMNYPYVCLCMYFIFVHYKHTKMHTYIYIYIYLCVCMYICIHFFIHICIYTYMYHIRYLLFRRVGPGPGGFPRDRHGGGPGAADADGVRPGAQERNMEISQTPWRIQKVDPP